MGPAPSNAKGVVHPCRRLEGTLLNIYFPDYIRTLKKKGHFFSNLSAGGQHMEIAGTFRSCILARKITALEMTGRTS